METISDVPILLRREIEALMVAPFLNAFAEELGWEKTREISRKVISELAKEAGKELAKTAGGNSLQHLNKVTSAFGKGGALTTKISECTDECMRMDVTECKYAQMYQEHGLGELGSLLSCERDTYLFEGFIPVNGCTSSRPLETSL